MTALPIEVDDALDALRETRELLGAAVDALHLVDAPMSLVLAYTEAHGVTATNVERLSDLVSAASVRARVTRDMDEDDDRRIEGGTFPWTEDDR